MKLSVILFGFAAAILAITIPRRTEAPEPYNLTLILEGTGENAVWRLTDENVPPHAWVAADAAVKARSPDKQHLEKRWTYQCYTSHAAWKPDCTILINSIQYSSASIPNSPRDIVYAGCYISWSAVVTGEQSDFWTGAYDVNQLCTFTGSDGYYVSGIARDYLALGVAQCLSNRASGCSY